MHSTNVSNEWDLQMTFISDIHGIIAEGGKGEGVLVWLFRCSGLPKTGAPYLWCLHCKL